jgi:hypothetical protein
MNLIKSWIASLVGPSLIGQFVRGITKVISGWLMGLGVQGELVGNFANAFEQILAAILIMLLSQGASAIATKKALETVPETPKIINK